MTETRSEKDTNGKNMITTIVRKELVAFRELDISNQDSENEKVIEITVFLFLHICISQHQLFIKIKENKSDRLPAAIS